MLLQLLALGGRALQGSLQLCILGRSGADLACKFEGSAEHSMQGVNKRLITTAA
jgi:hypothetical protein